MGGAVHGGLEVLAELALTLGPERESGLLRPVWGRLSNAKASRNDRLSPNCSAVSPFFTFSSSYTPESLSAILQLTFIQTHSGFLTPSPHLSQRIPISSPPIIPGFRGAFGLVPRRFFTLTRVARPFHTSKPNSVSDLTHQTPRLAVYAGVMASSDDDVPLKARKMKTNGVKQGKQYMQAARPSSLRASSKTITASPTLFFSVTSIFPLSG